MMATDCAPCLRLVPVLVSGSGSFQCLGAMTGPPRSADAAGPSGAAQTCVRVCQARPAIPLDESHLSSNTFPLETSIFPEIH